MIAVYSIDGKPPLEQPYRLRTIESVKQNWWVLDVVKPADFESAEHILNVRHEGEDSGASDDCLDIDEVDSAIWAFSERAWDWLPALEASGCRIASKVKVVRGNKRYKLVYPAPVLDLLDHKRTGLTWNAGTISCIGDVHLYEWEGEPPLMFQVLHHNRKMYRGVMESPSMKCFVSQAFVDEVTRRGLTGLDFTLLPRTKRPATVPEPDKVLVYRP